MSIMAWKLWACWEPASRAGSGSGTSRRVEEIADSVATIAVRVTDQRDQTVLRARANARVHV
jgi:hypothetical protein